MTALRFLGVALLSPVLNLPAAQAADPLLAAWTWRGEEVQEVVPGTDAVYVRSKDHVLAIDGRTGSIRWDAPVKSHGLTLLDDIVAVAAGSKLFLFDMRTGALTHQLNFVARVSLAGPPLVAMVRTRLAGSALYTIDGKRGAITAHRRFGRLLHGFIVEKGVVIATTWPSLPKGSKSDVLIGFRAEDLREIWRLPAESPDFESIDGTLCVRVIESHARDYQYLPIDARTGRLGPPLPGRFPINSDYGANTWELQILDSPRWKTERLRRNDIETGKPLWSTQMPGAPINRVRKGGTLYAWCLDGKRGYFAALDWATGRVLWSVQSDLRVRELFLLGERLLVWTFDDRVTALRIRTADS